MKKIIFIDVTGLQDTEAVISVTAEELGMLLIVINSGADGPERSYYSVNSKNIRKVAKSIHSIHSDTDYPSLEGVISNGYAKGLKELELKVPFQND